MDRLQLSEGLYLSSVTPSDKGALVEHLQVRAISRNTLHIPYPYTEADAEEWIERRRAHRADQPREVTFAIRTPQGMLIGVVGAGDFEIGSSHRANVGYWLAKPYWGQGIMTEALTRYARYAFDQMGIVRLTAEVFERNKASARVLEKVGFQKEGRLRKHRKKDGALLDVNFYGLLKHDLGELHM